MLYVLNASWKTAFRNETIISGVTSEIVLTNGLANCSSTHLDNCRFAPLDKWTR